MHSHFYHWHNRVAVKPEVSALEARWEAAVEATDSSSAASMVSLLKLVTSEAADATFQASYSEALVEADPTFPPKDNRELLRVMAAAAVFCQLQTSSTRSDIAALGIQSASFLGSRNTIVSGDIADAAMKYLSDESERMRGKTGLPAFEEKPVNDHLTAMKKQADAQVVPEVGKAVDSAIKLLSEGLSALTTRANEVINQLAEETEFLWWVVGRRSTALDRPREKLTDIDYAIVSAREMEELCKMLPPPLSAEHLLEEALRQCGTTTDGQVALTELLAKAVDGFESNSSIGPELTPIHFLLSIQVATAGKLTKEGLSAVGLGSKPKMAPLAFAKQAFRELVFLKSLASLS